MAKNYINHVVFVMDASSSMEHLTDQVIAVADNQMAYLAKRSTEMDQETRVTVYTFADTVKCLDEIYDRDALRLPSMKGHYRPYGWTALIDGAMTAMTDLAETPQKYGDHAFLVYIVTDGLENASKRFNRSSLKTRLDTLPGNWTVAVLVPDATAAFEAKGLGFAAGNVAVWDATSARGVQEVGETIKAATDQFMAARATGTRSTTNLFDISGAVVNDASVKAANLTPLSYKEYSLVPIPPAPGLVKPEDWDVKHPRTPWKAHGGRIDEFVQNVNEGKYRVGQAFYQLTEGKTEKIQPSKEIAVVDKVTDRVYTGDGARKLLNLPDMEVRVKPSAADKYLIFVQSKSPNRKLVVGARLLIMN